MSAREFSESQESIFFRYDLAHEAVDLIKSEMDFVMRGHMINAAIDEGVAVTAEAILNNIDRISDEDERGPDVVTPYQKKNSLVQESVIALANQGLFGETDRLIDFIETRDSFGYLQNITTLLKHGYAGADKSYLGFSTSDIRTLALSPRHYSYPEKNEYGKLSTQQFYLENYLEGLAQYGIDIFTLNSEYSAMLFTINELGALKDAEAAKNERPFIISRDTGHLTELWQSERRLTRYGQAYVEGGHAELAIACKDMIRDHHLRAGLCMDIIEQSDDPDIKTKYLNEVMELQEQIATCHGECGFAICKPSEPSKELRLRILHQQAQQGTVDALQVQEQLGGPEFHFSYEQMLVNLEIYKQTGDEHARNVSLSFLNDFTFYRQEIIAEHIRAIGEADIHWNRTVPYPEAEDETVPLVCYEIERVFWGIEKYLRTITGNSSNEPVEFDPNFDRGQPDESQRGLLDILGMNLDEYKEGAVGPLSKSFGEEAVEDDLRMCLEQRDRAFVVLVTLLAMHESPSAARYFLSKIDAADDRVRAMLALAKL